MSNVECRVSNRPEAEAGSKVTSKVQGPESIRLPRMRIVLAALLACSLACASTTSPPKPEPPRISETRMEGFLPLHWNEKDGTLLLEIPRLDQELIYQVSLASGVGSNPLGLDRGQLGATHLIRFERRGPRVLMVEPNLRFRTLDGSAGERRAVEESFASSILWSFPIERESDGRLVVDATEFFL